MKFNPLLTCRGCKERVPVKEMQYDKTGTALLCRTCTAKQGKPVMEHVALGRLAREQQMLQSGKRMHFICTSCGYKFSRHENYKFWQKCPSCAKDTVWRDVRQTADHLLRESQRMDTVLHY